MMLADAPRYLSKEEREAKAQGQVGGMSLAELIRQCSKAQ